MPTGRCSDMPRYATPRYAHRTRLGVPSQQHPETDHTTRHDTYEVMGYEVIGYMSSPLQARVIHSSIHLIPGKWPRHPQPAPPLPPGKSTLASGKCILRGAQQRQSWGAAGHTVRGILQVTVRAACEEHG